jgi:hypothetical protein
MSPELQKALQQLADKLGVGVDRLLACLLKQAPIDATINIVAWLALLAATGGMTLACWRVYKRMQTSPDSDNEIILIMLGTLAAGLGAGLLIMFCQGAAVTLAGFFNPDYWALHQILHP